MKLNPKLRIHFDLAERVPDLEKEGIDILFGLSVEGPPEMVRRRVSTTRYVLSATPTYFKQFGQPKTPQDLIHHHYITHSMRQPSNAIFLKDERIIYVQPILWLNDSFAMRACALRHMGIVNLHDYMVTDALQSGELIEILKEYQEPQKNVYLYYQQARYVQPKIRHFIDFFSNISH